jgi:hypothetical protein
MSRISSRANKGQRTSAKFDGEHAENDKPEKLTKKAATILDLASEQIDPKPASKAKSKPRDTIPLVKKKTLPVSKAKPKSKAETIVRADEAEASQVGEKRKADSQISPAAALAWDMEIHPEEKRLAAYRPRCSDACK